VVEKKATGRGIGRHPPNMKRGVLKVFLGGLRKFNFQVLHLVNNKPLRLLPRDSRLGRTLSREFLARVVKKNALLHDVPLRAQVVN